MELYIFDFDKFDDIRQINVIGTDQLELLFENKNEKSMLVRINEE